MEDKKKYKKISFNKLKSQFFLDKNIVLIISFLMIITFVTAKEDRINSQLIKKKKLFTKVKIDTNYVLQKKMYKKVVKNPLKNKKYGIDINPIRLLFYSSKRRSFSCGFSFFKLKKDVEIYLPIYFKNFKSDLSGYHFFILDVRYRVYLGESQYRWFIGGLVRFNNFYSKTYKEINGLRIGNALEFGYRIFSYRGLQWGISFYFGRYLTKNPKNLEKNIYGVLDFITYTLILNIEVFNVGWTF